MNVHSRLREAFGRRIDYLMSHPEELKRIEDEIKFSAERDYIALIRSGGVLLPKYCIVTT